MFSGIIQAVEPIESIEQRSKGARISLTRPEVFTALKPGASVAVDGVCLTIESDDSERMWFYIGAETNSLLSWTERFSKGQRVNLEASLHLGDPVDGHFVTGHVDSLGEVLRREEVGDSLVLDIRVHPQVLGLIWKKGSIAINGVSLTINELTENQLSVCLIPETRKRTNLEDLKVGGLVHVEPDVLARMVERQLSSYIQLRQGSKS